MRAKAFRNVLLITVVAIAIGGGLFFGLMFHRQSAKTNLLTKISANADVAVIYWDALSQLKNSEKKWRFPDWDSTNNLTRVFSSPLAMGIDISINPVLFRNPNDSSFQLVLSLLDQSKFEKWLTESAGKYWHSTLQHQPKFDVCTFDNQDFAFVFDKDFALLVSNAKRANYVGSAFFDVQKPEESSQVKLPERRSADEIMAIRWMSDEPLFNQLPTPLLIRKTFFLAINENQIRIETERPVNRQLSNQFIWNSDDMGNTFRPTKLLRELWKISPNQQSMLDGKWQLLWKGYQERELVYSSYVFDDNFNRIPEEVIIMESYPDFSVQFIPERISQLDSLKSHITQNGFLKKNKVKIGPYENNFSEINGRWIIGNEKKFEVFTDVSMGVNVNVPQLLGDLNKLKIPTLNVDSFASNNLKMIDIQLGPQHFQTRLTTVDDCPYHILAILNRFFKA